MLATKLINFPQLYCNNNVSNRILSLRSYIIDNVAKDGGLSILNTVNLLIFRRRVWILPDSNPYTHLIACV